MVADEVEHDEAAIDRLHRDAQAFESAVLALRDSIQGSQHLPNGGVYVTHIAAAARSVIYSLGRLGNILDKAGVSLDARAATAYLDYLGEQTDATAPVVDLADHLITVGRELSELHDRHFDLVSKLGAIGQR